jgi:molybdate transport system substrate-binding protein
VKVVARFPETSHPPIVYPAALIRASTRAEAARFLETLRMPASAAILAREGFIPLD